MLLRIWSNKRKKSVQEKKECFKRKQSLEEDAEKEELKWFLDIIPREDVAEDVESLSTKYPIMDWKTYTLTENFMYYQVFRGDGSSKNYKVLSEMLEDFDIQDVEELYRLVKEKYSASRPEGYDLMLWGDLHTLFEPDEEDEIWKNQHEYNKKYPLSQELISKMLKNKLEVDHEISQAFELLRTTRSTPATTTTPTTFVTDEQLKRLIAQGVADVLAEREATRSGNGEDNHDSGIVGTALKEQDTSSRSGNDAHADDADIRPIYDEEPMAKVQTTAEINVFATGQQHTEQPEFNNEGEVDQNVEQLITTHYLPKEREFAVAKPHHMIAPGHLGFPSNKTTTRYYTRRANKVLQRTPERQIPKRIGLQFNKNSVVHEKTMTHRSCLRWKPTGKNFKTVGLRWVPTGKIFTSSTTKVDSEPQNGHRRLSLTSLNRKQTLAVSDGSELGIHDHSNEQSSSKLVPKVVPQAVKTAIIHDKKESSALSWKPCQGDSLNLPDHSLIKEIVRQAFKMMQSEFKVNGVTRTKKYVKLSVAEKIQADCDIKATNIILQGLPADIYSLINHHKVAKDLWERVQLLMQGTSLTKHERECKLYDAFDKFSHIKGESLHKYYLRFTQLINYMNIYNMKMEQI
ncbi:hypothetical protein Tco_0040796 [Tanacetum coccineum]